jgi:hypothetical protein
MGKERISSAIFDRLVDYVNCKYIEAYIGYIIESGRQPPENKDFFCQKYNYVIRPKLINCTIDKHPDYDRIYNLLDQNHWLIQEVKTLLNWIDGKKYDKNSQSALSDNKKIIEWLIKLDDSNIAYYLQETTNRLRKELYSKYCGPSGSFPEETQSTPQNEGKKQKRQSILQWFGSSQSSNERDEKIETGLTEQSNKTRSPEQPRKSNISGSKSLEERVWQLEMNVRAIEDKLQQMERRFGQQFHSIYNTQNMSIASMPKDMPPEKPNVKYLRMKSGSSLSQESDSPEGGKFKLFDIVGDRAKFEFCGDEQAAIANKDATFDNVCEDSGYYLNARRIESVEPGEVQRQDGKWKVIKKAKIKFV